MISRYGLVFLRYQWELQAVLRFVEEQFGDAPSEYSSLKFVRAA